MYTLKNVYHEYDMYRKVPKFSDAKNFAVVYLKFKQRGLILARVFCQKDANGITNREDPDQTAPVGAV